MRESKSSPWKNDPKPGPCFSTYHHIVVNCQGRLQDFLQNVVTTEAAIQRDKVLPPHYAWSMVCTNNFRIGAIVAVAIAVALIVWLIVKDDGSKKSTAQSAPPATAASVQQLRDTQGSVGHQVYWAGPRAGFTYELTQVNGNVFVRYLPAGTGLGDPRPNFLTVGTYPKRNALASLKRLARRSGNTSNKLSARRTRCLQRRPAPERLLCVPRLQGADRGLRPLRTPVTSARAFRTSQARRLSCLLATGGPLGLGGVNSKR